MNAVDLSGLRRGAPAHVVPRRPLGPRLAALGVSALVLALLASFAWDWIFPPRVVASGRPRLEQGIGGRAAARVVAEASGWVEPEPFATIVRPLVDARVDELLVLEGAVVKRGETVIAKLASAELLAATERARSEQRLRAARVKETEAKVARSLAALEQRGALREQEIDARRATETAVERLAAAGSTLVAAESDVLARRAELEGQQALEKAGASFPVALAKARAEIAGAEARREAAQRSVRELEKELAQSARALELAEELLENPRELRSEHEMELASLEVALLELATADTALAIAERELAWCTVLAPVDGVVMKLLAAPGSEVGPAGEGIVALYDPARLQARVDVPLAMVASVREGQAVEVRSEVTGSRVTSGRVSRVQRESDLLKNTLQVKVTLEAPDPSLRPETLCRARFQAPEDEGGERLAEARWWVPSAAVHGGAVYVLDPDTERARRLPVDVLETGGAESLVRGDLSATQRVLLEAVVEGERVRLRTEERP